MSHVDSFDPKVLSGEYKGKQLVKSPWEFKKNGQTGAEISDLFPNIAQKADDLCLIRSLTTGHGNHFEATLGLHTGSFSFPKPSIGSWISYALGSINENLPSFITIAPQLPYAGSQLWSPDFLPGQHIGTRITDIKSPVPNIIPGKGQNTVLDLLRQLNGTTFPEQLKSFETAAKMQMAAPEAFDISKESQKTKESYGISDKMNFGWQALMARRLVERGVRFLELIDTGSSNNWDSHDNIERHGKLAENVDRPCAYLLEDLKSRGLLESTLVVFATEFGRTPWTNKLGGLGREHHPEAFTCWLAGGGVKPGVYGKTDEIGEKPIENKCDMHDFHATILHGLGINHTELTYRNNGRDFRLTDVAGNILPLF